MPADLDTVIARLREVEDTVADLAPQREPIVIVGPRGLKGEKGQSIEGPRGLKGDKGDDGESVDIDAVRMLAEVAAMEAVSRQLVVRDVEPQVVVAPSQAPTAWHFVLFYDGIGRLTDIVATPSPS